MKHILNITTAESEAFNSLLSEYRDTLTKVDWDISEFTCRFSFSQTKLILECSTEKNIVFNVHAYEENYAMLARKSIPPFDIKFSFSNGHMNIIRMPKNKEVAEWLYSTGGEYKRSVKDSLGYIIVHSFIAINSLNPIFIKRQNGDTIEYSFPPHFKKIAKEYEGMKSPWKSPY